MRATQYNGTDKYLPGEFVFINTGLGGPLTQFDAQNWSHRFNRGEDLAFLAEFTTREISEPGSLALMGLGLVGLGLARRKKAA